jgi:very-short-patch-repair endonuclease
MPGDDPPPMPYGRREHMGPLSNGPDRVPTPSPKRKTDLDPRAARARKLRRRQTPAETALWTLLRGSRLTGLKFKRQHPIDRYVADFTCESARLIIELDGAVHDDETQAAADAERQAVLESLGWFVLRFSNEAVHNRMSAVLETILDRVRLAGAGTPHPPTQLR